MKGSRAFVEDVRGRRLGLGIGEINPEGSADHHPLRLGIRRPPLGFDVAVLVIVNDDFVW